MIEQYTIVMPIKIHAHEHDELRRFIEIQLRSLNKFLHVPSIHEFLIICKENEMSIIQKALQKHPSPLPIRLLSEKLIVKESVVNKTAGWYLQQILKLGAANIVKTPLYLVLDSDCFLTKPFAYQDLFYEGKILLDKEPWTNHPDWWLDVTKIIDIPFTKLAAQLTIAVTPQILITEAACELLDYLGQKAPKKSWDEYLSSQFFTEFTLYWLFLLKTNKIDRYQLSGEGPSLLGNALWMTPWSWHKRQSISRLLKRFFNNRRRQRKFKVTQTKETIKQLVKTSFESNTYFHFSLIQSHIHEISVDWIIEQTNKYLS